MPVQKRRRLFNFLGLISWGDLGPTTFYRRPDKRAVWFGKTWPKDIPSALQLDQRARFISAAQAWRALTPDQRATWTLAARRSYLCMTGYNLWLFASLSPDPTAINTVARQTHLPLWIP